MKLHSVKIAFLKRRTKAYSKIALPNAIRSIWDKITMYIIEVTSRFNTLKYGAIEVLGSVPSHMKRPGSIYKLQYLLVYYSYTGLFAFYLGTAPDQLELARQNLLAEIEKLATEGMSDEALGHSKTSVLATDALEHQSNRAMAQGCAINTLFGLGPQHHEENAKRIEALTAADIKEVAARYFASREPVIATVLPKA